MFYVIDGGSELKGTIEVSGAKNVALKLIIAALLCEGKSIIHNVPRIRDVFSLIDVINAMGGKANFVSGNTVEVENTLKHSSMPLEFAAKTRVSFMLLIPLLYTFGKCRIPNPGGCRLGERPVDRFIEGLLSSGVDVQYNSTDGCYHATREALKGVNYRFVKQSHTGTEFLLMHMAIIESGSKIENAAREPEIDELIDFLNKAGAEVRREGNSITVQGGKLHGVETTVGSDRNEAVSFLVLAALNNDITVKNIEITHIRAFLDVFSQAGFKYDYDEQQRSMRVYRPKHISAHSIVTSPHPGFMTDWQPLWAILMTQAEGTSLIHETVFESRFNYVPELIKHGAKITFADIPVDDPQRTYQFNVQPGVTPRNQAILITGPTALHNGVTHMADLRAGACLVIAALISPGRTVIDGAEQVERGYEAIVEKLKEIGANITTS